MCVCPAQPALHQSSGKDGRLTIQLPEYPPKALHRTLTREDQSAVFPPRAGVQRAGLEEPSDGLEVRFVEVVLEDGDEGGAVVVGGEEFLVAVGGRGFGL